MGTIYGDEHDSLKTILARAGKNEDATLLIPDLQRPYVWQPSQVILLLDSLIRGWPFGTLLTWKVEQDDPARELARSFWRVIDRVSEVEGEPFSKRHPPATFQMVLDGQQRIQSLLLALGGGPYRRLDSSIAQLETPAGCAELMRPRLRSAGVALHSRLDPSRPAA